MSLYRNIYTLLEMVLPHFADPGFRRVDIFKFITLLLTLSVLTSCATTVKGPDRSMAPPKAVALQSTIEELEADSSQGYYNYLKALIFERKGEYLEAVDQYRLATVRDENLVQAYERTAGLLLRMGKVTQAKEMALKGVAVSPDNVSLLMTLGGIHSSLEQRDEAIRNFSRVTELKPERREAWIYLAVAYFQAELYDDALSVLDSYTTKFPDDPLGYYYAGKAMGKLKKYDDAEKIFIRLIGRFPMFSKGHEGLAAVYRLDNKLDKAVETYNKYLELNPSDQAMRKRLADTYIQLESYEKAIDEFEDLVEQRRDDVELNFKLGLTHLRQAQVTGRKEEYEKALTQLQLVRASQPENNQVVYYIASIFEAMNMPGEAIKVWESLLAGEHPVDEKEIYLKISDLYESSGSTEKSLHYVYKALEVNPSDSEIRYFAGRLLTNMRRYDEAATEFSRSIELTPSNGKYYFHLGVVYEKLKKYEECIAAMKRVIELDPNHADALNYLGYLYAERNIKLDGAEEYLMKAISLEPDNGYFKDSLGWIYYRQGRLDEALQQTQEAIRAIPPDPTVLEHLGDIFLARGERDMAIDAYQRSLDADPSDGSTLPRETVIKKLSDTKKQLDRE